MSFLPLFSSSVCQRVVNQIPHFRFSTTMSSKKSFDYSAVFNDFSNRRQPSIIRELTKVYAGSDPGSVIFMAGGFPNPSLFPFESLSIQMDATSGFNVKGEELRAALQYQPTLGYPQLVKIFKDHIRHFHNPPNWENTDLIVTVGSQHGLSSFFETVLSVNDTVVVPQPVYTAALAIMDPYCPKYLAVPEDSQGMQPQALESILAQFASSKSDEKKAKILYVNPVGANPSGVNITGERKREIYQIARLHDLIILEDDPYYFLHFEKENPVSFLSMDVDGRVVRLDSLSKILSSGLRVGYTTGPKEIIRKLELSVQHSILHASSLSQVLAAQVLTLWGIPGFNAHVDKVKEFYKERRDLMLAAAKKHLTGLATWVQPMGGMFLWIKVLGVEDTWEMVMDRGIKEGVMLLPGKVFNPDKSPSPYLRASYSVVAAEDLDKGFQRLAALIRTEQKKYGP